MINYSRILVALLSATSASIGVYAQTNSFPASGNVGIGTAAPGTILDVNGNVNGWFWQQIRNGSNGADAKAALALTNPEGYQLRLIQTSSAHSTSGVFGPYAGIVDATGPGGLRLAAVNGPLSLWTGNPAVQRFTVNASGNVGIGTLNPAATLDLAGSMRVKAPAGAHNNIALDATEAGREVGFVFYDAGVTKWQLYKTSGNDLNVYNYATGRSQFTLSSNGFVGLNTLSPQYPLDVRHDQNTATYVTIQNSSTGSTGSAGFYAKNNTNSGVALTVQGSYHTTAGLLKPNYGSLGTDSSLDGLSLYTSGTGDPILFGTEGVERMRLTSSGNLGIGVDSPVARVHIHTPTGTALRSSTAGAGGWGAEFNNYDGGTDRSVYLAGPSYAAAFLNGNVGIGTSAPSARLTVYKNNNGNTTGAGNAAIYLPADESTIQGPADTTQVRMGSNLILGAANELYLTIGGSPHVALKPNGNLGVGTVNPTEKLSVNGKVRAREVIVETTGWSDYVFAEDYRLSPLSEVEHHIKTHKHLPGVPSAEQVSQQGVSVGEMQATLLAKIEELTLHVIAQQKQLENQAAEIRNLKALVSPQ